VQKNCLHLKNVFPFQMKKLRETIELASGKCELFDEDIHFSSLFDTAYVFMESDAPDTNDYQTKITLILEK